MPEHTYLLYILSQSVSSIKPALISKVYRWYEATQGKDASMHQFLDYLRLSKDQYNKFLSLAQSISHEVFFNTLHEHHNQAVTLLDEGYPHALKQLPDPSLVLYYQGDLAILRQHCIAMVGSRHNTRYGVHAVEKILSGLRGYKFTIISGLAFGIDSASHTEALRHALATVAVLGSGISEQTIYPKNNVRLVKDIINGGGLIISEYPPLTSAMKHQFIARNRIIAGLSDITIIVEAAAKSGSLITADFALEYNRGVYAVPGSIFSDNSSGCHDLLSQGANILRSSIDILHAFNLEPTRTDLVQFTDLQMRVIECIQIEPCTLETIAQHTDIPVSELISIISELELAQKIKLMPDQTYLLF